MTIDAHHLSCLLAIARTGSFSRAAEEIGQSQPTLSNNIALLEQRLGVRVLERSKRGSTLTPHGEILVRRAEGLQLILEDAETEVRNLNLTIAGPLRVGTTPSALPALVPLALKLLGPTLNASMIEIVEGLDQSLNPQLLAGKLDVVVGPVKEPFIGVEGIEETAILTDPFCIAVAPHSPLARLTQIALADLTEQMWVLPHPGSTYRRHIEAMFLTQDIPWPANAIFSNSLFLLEAMVTAGDCVSVVSPVQMRVPPPPFSILALKKASIRKIGFKARSRTRLSPLAIEFRDALFAAADRMVEDFGHLGLSRA